MSTTATQPGAGPAPTSKHAESALPTTIAALSRIPGERPTAAVPFTRLVRLETRKQLDTRAGRWLLISIAAIIATALTIMFFNNGGEHPFGDYLQATTMPMALLLPVVGVLAVTSEWSQRTGLVTFALEPRRMRVGWAKLVSALLVGAGGLRARVRPRRRRAPGARSPCAASEGDWQMQGLALLGAALFVLLGVAQGVAFGMLLRNTPAAIVLLFVLPTAWAILGGLVDWIGHRGPVARPQRDDGAALLRLADR